MVQRSGLPFSLRMKDFKEIFESVSLLTMRLKQVMAAILLLNFRSGGMENEGGRLDLMIYMSVLGFLWNLLDDVSQF